MKRCFSCGNEIDHKETIHKKCLHKLFGIEVLPRINLSLAEISQAAQKMSGKLSISGIQPKLSLKLNKKSNELEIALEGGEFILKPQIATFPNLPQNENLCMTIAQHLGISVPPHALIQLKDESCAYIVKRFDRDKNIKIHQEDFFQILEKRDKYSGSLEEIGKKLKDISAHPFEDLKLFYQRVLFFFIIGNGDAHMKNFSMLSNDRGQCRLSPAYDIVSSKLVIPDEEDFALSIKWKKNKLQRKDFEAFARYLGIEEKVTLSIFHDKKEDIESLIKDSELSKTEKKMLIEIVGERFSRLLKP